MQPIFPEYIHFLSDSGCDVSWFKERLFWLDNNLVKAFVRGQLTPLYRVFVDDALSVTLKKHKKNVDGLQFESWDETIVRMLPHIEQLEAESIETLHKHCQTDRRIVNTNSTGKDSMVVTHLASKAGLEFETFFNVTTLDVAESNRMAKCNGFKCIYPNPKYGGFYKYIKSNVGGVLK